jgi:hypothetical protein
MFRGIRKATRKKLAKSEGYMLVACSAQRWADEIGGKERMKRFEDWGHDDPFVTLARTYGLTKDDLVKLFTQIGQELEDRALRLGYDQHWDEADFEPAPFRGRAKATA